MCLYFSRQDTEGKRSGQPMLDLIETSLTPPPNIYYIAQVANFRQISFLVYTYWYIVSVNLPSKKSWHMEIVSFPLFISSFTVFIIILGYFHQYFGVLPRNLDKCCNVLASTFPPQGVHIGPFVWNASEM